MDASRERYIRALAILEGHGQALGRTARRFSLCRDDADDALQRAIVILLTKGPPYPEPRLLAWMQVVTRREALALRRERERMLGGELSERIAGTAPSAAERFERREKCAERAHSLARLKPDERRALILKGQGYSYSEICRATGWTYTKVNRCLAEGRARLREIGALA